MPTTRRTKGAVLAPVYDDPMPRRPRSRATSVASSQRSNDDHYHRTPVTPAVISHLESHNEDLTAENQNLREELQKQKSKRWTLRDKHLAEQLAEYHAKHPVESEQQQEQEVEQANEEEVTPKKQSFSTQDSLTQTPTQKTSTDTSTPATVPRWRQLLSSLGGFSPFPARKSNTQRVERAQKQPQTINSPLGQLPQNRKRPAPAEEDEEQEEKEKKAKETPTRKKTKAPESQAQEQGQSTSTDTPQPLDTISEQGQSTSSDTPQHLDTISEQAELPAEDFAARTPSREPRKQPQTERPATRTHDMDHTPRRRTIRDVRAAQTSRSALPPSGLRRWETPTKPREPNADKRLARMQQLEQAKKEKQAIDEKIARLAAEQEADGIDIRKRKRVKVDELAYIPHNQPGDAKSTFRVPEWDSDDEMEVDEEVPVRKNVFSLNAEQSVPSSTTTTAADTAALTTTTKSTASTQQAMPAKSMFTQTVQEGSAKSLFTQPAQEGSAKSLFAQPVPEVSAKSLFTQSTQAIPPKSLFAQPSQVDTLKASFSKSTQDQNINPPVQSTNANPANALHLGTSLFSKSAARSTELKPLAASSTSNIFSQPAPAVSTTPDPLPKADLFQSASQPTVSSKFNWPLIGTKQIGEEWLQKDKLAAGQKFARGFDSWLAVGLQA